MSLAPGDRLGPYEILGALGAGGMGEVYRARDTRLDRTVAIKVLRLEVAADADRRARFEREARTISALQHPHICALHDVGVHEGLAFLVIEYLEGGTLADRLAKGPLPIDLVLRYGIEIADALACAHRQGIVHRDLKPANVMLTRAGAKLLDFGLAKPDAVSALSLTETTTRDPLTAEGTLVGTFQYMAPEQLEGRDADRRSDIWALGCVLYEMATGKPAFSGGTQASLIAAILGKDPPPVSAARAMTPPALDRIVRKCLAKDPDERWESAHDLVEELRWIGETHGPVASSRVGGARIALAAVAIAGVVAVAAWIGYRVGRSPAPGRDPLRLTVALPEGQSLVTGRGSALVFAPDGRRLVYVGSESGVARLYVRALDALQPTPLAGTDGADAPFFSADGAWIAFFAGGKLKKVPVGGGAVTTVCAARDGRGGTWAPDDTIIFTPDGGSGLSRVAAAGGEPRPLTRPQRADGERSHRWPHVVPGGRSVVFTVGPAAAVSYDQAPLALASLETGEVTRLNEQGFAARVTAGGLLLLVRGSTLYAAPFDSRTGKTTGTAVPLVEDVRTNASGAAHFAVSDGGAIAYVTGGEMEARRTLTWVQPDGKEQAVLDERLDYLHPRVSPDGQRVLVAIRKAGGPDVWVYDAVRATLMRLTTGGEGGRAGPIWSPDGARAAYVSWGRRDSRILWKPLDGSAPEEEIVRTDGLIFGLSFSRDGRTLLYGVRRGEGEDIMAVDLATHTSRPMVAGPADEGAPAISPDGRWLASMSSESGRPEVYVQPFPGPGGRWQVSNEGGEWPVWARDGRTLFYRGNRLVMAVDISPGEAFRPGVPRSLMRDVYLSTFFDVGPDGRFVFVRTASDSSAPPAVFNLELDGPLAAAAPRR